LDDGTSTNDALDAGIWHPWVGCDTALIAKKTVANVRSVRSRSGAIGGLNYLIFFDSAHLVNLGRNWIALFVAMGGFLVLTLSTRDWSF
jgi:hypothetical protein